MTTVSAIDLATLSDDTLKALQTYWQRRLNSRGGSWLAAVMVEAAREMLADIEQEWQRRGVDHATGD